MLQAIRVGAIGLALLCAGGCSSSKAKTSSAPRGSANAVTAEEISSTGTSNVYDALQRLRPQWLTSSRLRRGGSGDELHVYLDATRYGSLESLKSLSTGGVVEVLYYGASEATNRFGTGHTGGAIVVRMTK